MLDWDQFDILTFDCYGTLIDWEGGILAAAKPILAARKVEMDDEQFLALFSQTEPTQQQPPYRAYREVLQSTLAAMGEQLGFTPSDDERAAFAGSVAEWPPFPDTVDALTVLKNHKKLAILSNVDDDLFAGSARQLGVEFDAVYTAQQIGSYKPDLRNFQYMLEHIGVPQERILHCAQSLFHDIKPAREIGLTTVWVNRRKGRAGSGATHPTEATPHHEVPDLATLASQIAP